MDDEEDKDAGRVRESWVAPERWHHVGDATYVMDCKNIRALGRIYGACGDNRPSATDMIDIIDIIGIIDIIVILLCFC